LIFTEPRFVFFFAVVFAVHWALRNNRARKVWLLCCSYLFYAAWDWRFLSLIFISTIVDYIVGLRLAAVSDEVRRRYWVTLSVVTNLGLLGIFKYFNFFVDSLADLLAFIGLPAPMSTLSIVLPVGISFYTFQTMSYSIDIYRNRLSPTRDLLDLALFVGFFPQLVAGPIIRARVFLPQLEGLKSLANVNIRSALVLFLVGFFKKACVSDNIAPFVDSFFASPESFTAASAWIATLLYAAQIYCDFSGYSDMAIACARLLGFEFGVNFNFPYLATSIREFWRRWHISLSTWLRDYLYISLGGNRGPAWFVYRNLMLTMLLGGLWHGAAWNFVIWGGLHGLALSVHRLWVDLPIRDRIPVAVRSTLGWALTFYWANLTWIFFRAPDLSSAIDVTRSFVLLQDLGPDSLDPRLWILLAGLAMLHVAGFLSLRSSWWQRLPSWAFATGYGVLAAIALGLVQTETQPFIYFQF
jgi:alginate O-acetyltransferase complex protein AlgI